MPEPSTDPLKPGERADYEEDLISFCDRELGLLGDVRGLNVLYAGGSSLLWLEGLSQRIGEEGRLAALELGPDRVRDVRSRLGEASLSAPVRLVAGDVFEPPFDPDSLDLVYSAGLFHELDVRERPARSALAALASVTRPGGRIATSDYVDVVAATHLGDEDLQRDLAREAWDRELYGIGSPERLVALHEEVLENVSWRILPPYPIRYLDRTVLHEDEPPEFSDLPTGATAALRLRRRELLERIRREGYTRPATVYIEGRVGGA